MASKGNKAENVKKTAPWFAPSQMKKFAGEVKAEYLKIVWPNWKTTLGLTGIVVVLSLVISIYLGSVDLLLGRIISSILR